jgi:hypothetical protein
MIATLPVVALTASSFDAHVTARMLEFAEPATPWYRRLWQPGSLLLADELLEASVPSHGASSHARSALLRQLTDRMMKDPGAAAPSARSALLKALPQDAEKVVAPGHDWQLLRQLSAQLRSSYLTTWGAALRAAPGAVVAVPSPERTARLLAAHLLTSGWSAKYLHRWLIYHIRHDAIPYTLADLCDLAHTRTAAGSQPIEICVPLAADPPLPRPTPAGWLTSLQVRHWRAQHIPGSSPIRQHGALLLHVDAHDIYAGAELAREKLSQMVARFQVGGRRPLTLGPDMWIKGVPEPQPIAGSPRRVEVHAFERTDALWQRDLPEELESALELMAPLDRGPAVAATTGAWAAIESQLVGPGDSAKVVAAERLALIVACGLARAELTSLAWAHHKANNDKLAADIGSAGTNKDRAALALAAVTGAAQPLLKPARPSDIQALERLAGLVQDPYRYVHAVASHIRVAFLALYRQRNLLSHSGVTSAVALRPTLTIAAPLVGAGMDRIAHVALTRGESALQLAARARIQLTLLGRKGVQAVVDLLE